MIQYKKGDLFTTEDKVIAHGCNAQGVMGSGVAKQIKDKYPSAYRIYHDRFMWFAINNYNRFSLGTYTKAEENGKIIYNLVTQKDYGRDRNITYVHYESVKNSFILMCSHETEKNISIPKIGSGLANGDWNIIEKIIEKISNRYEKNITIWEL